MQQIPGVEEVISGYSGGRIANPTYREVCSGLTGHAEVVRLKFDPQVISYIELLKIFFRLHNPFLDTNSRNKSQYRSIILYHSEDQKTQAQELMLNMEKQAGKPIFTELAPFTAFYKAEEHHQDYYRKDPQKSYCKNIIEPKIQNLKKVAGEILIKPYI